VTDRDGAATSALCAKIGPWATPVELDVAQEAAWVAALARVETCFGRLDILVNNAGVLSAGDAEDLALAEFQCVNAIMSEGVFLGCKHAMPLLRRSGAASIVNIASVTALRGYSGFLAYVAAKGAVRAMTRAIAVAAQDRGDAIRCNAVFPGDIETPMQQSYDRREAKAVPAGVLPAGTVGAPADVAAAVLFLASDESRFVTGAELVVDNGATARPGW
jgi:3(or 17)beta-hydroxysteroid dehydrogenase